MARNHQPLRWQFWSELRLIAHRGRQVWRMVPNRQKLAFAVAGVLMTLTSFASVGVPVTVGRLVDAMNHGVQDGVTGANLFWIAASFLGIIAALVVTAEILQVLRRYTVENTCTRIEKYLNVKVVSHLLKVEVGTLTHERIGSLNGRIFRSIDGYMRFLRAGFLDFLPACLTGLLALCIVTVKAPWIGLVMLTVLPLTLSLTAWQLLSQKDIRLHLMRSREELDGIIIELLGGLDYVRVADTYEQETRRISRFAEKRRRDELKHHVAMALFGAAKALTQGFFHLLVLGLSVMLAVSGQNSFGDILAFSALFLSVMTPMAEIHRILDEGHEAALRVGDLLSLLSQKVDESFQTVTQYVACIGNEQPPIIDVQGLHVVYTTAEGQPVAALKGVDLRIRPGEKIGVVGRSGCGKSTLVKVLMRIIHPKSGEVRLRGKPIHEVSRKEISRLLGYVGQSPFVFRGTIAENILYGCQGTFLQEDIQSAASRACIHEEIMAMTDGYDTEIAEKGSNLSGGQRQRLALARIFLKDPSILILDEATSALDTINERNVQRAIEAASSERTVIMVAHRLSSLIDADRILVFDAGRVVEEGAYHDLIKQGGLFAELVVSAGGSRAAAPIEAADPVAT